MKSLVVTGLLCCGTLLFVVLNYLKVMKIETCPVSNPCVPLKCGDILLFKNSHFIRMVSPFRFSHCGLAINEHLFVELLPGKPNVRFSMIQNIPELFVRRINQSIPRDKVALFLNMNLDSTKYSHFSYIQECLFRMSQLPCFLPYANSGPNRRNNCASFLAQLLNFCGVLQKKGVSSTYSTCSWLPDDFAYGKIRTVGSYHYGTILVRR